MMAHPAAIPVPEAEPDSLKVMAADVGRGLSGSPKELPCRYLYDDVGGALFDAITALPEYYLTRAETEILSAHATEVIERTRPEFLVELGAGSCSKTRILLDAARRSGRLRGFVPFDISRSSLDRVAQELVDAYPGLAIHAIVGDFVSQLEIVPRLGRQLVMFLGSTIGNLADDECGLFLRRIRSMLEPDDAFLVGVDLVKDESILVAAYNDAQGVTARFNLNLLARLNRELQADFDLDAFSHVARYNPQKSQMEIYVQSQKSQVVSIPGAGLCVMFRRGELVRTEISRKFTRRQVEALLGAARMRLTGWYTDTENRFAVGLAVAVAS